MQWLIFLALFQVPHYQTVPRYSRLQLTTWDYSRSSGFSLLPTQSRASRQIQSPPKPPPFRPLPPFYQLHHHQLCQFDSPSRQTLSLFHSSCRSQTLAVTVFTVHATIRTEPRSLKHRCPLRLPATATVRHQYHPPEAHPERQERERRCAKPCLRRFTDHKAFLAQS